MCPLRIQVKAENGGVRYELDPDSIKAVQSHFPEASPVRSVAVDFVTGAAFSKMHGRVWEHIGPYLLGIKKDQIDQLGGIELFDADRNVVLDQDTTAAEAKARDVQALVEAHSGLGDEMTEAVWIRQGDFSVWLVEVLPGLADDPAAATPVRFSPGDEFRYPLCLITGNLRSLKSALENNPEFAQWVAHGTLVVGSGELKAAAREAARAGS